MASEATALPGAKPTAADPSGTPDTLPGLATPELVARVGAHPLFAATDPGRLAKLVGLGSLLTLRPGDALIRQGEDSDAAFVILEGTADVETDTNYGAVHLATVPAPALVGEIGVLTGVPRTATVRAGSALRVLRVAAPDLQAFGVENPKFLADVMRQFGRRFQAFNNAVGFYSNALQALRERDFDLRLLDELRTPPAELLDFAQSFRSLAEEIVARRAHRDEMANATAIQRSMLPAELPRTPSGALDVFAHIVPAREVGGDFYDHFLLDEHRLAIVIGDVSGKGIPAALFMASTLTALRIAIKQHGALDLAVAAANNLLVANNSESMFATLFCAVIDLRSGALSACNCGHPPPFLIRPNGDHCRIASSGLPLGLKAGASFKIATATMTAGDLIFLATDGLTDAANGGGEAYGEARLEGLVVRLDRTSARDFVMAAVDSVTDFAKEAVPFDDIAGLAFVFHAVSSPGLK